MKAEKADAIPADGYTIHVTHWHLSEGEARLLADGARLAVAVGHHPGAEGPEAALRIVGPECPACGASMEFSEQLQAFACAENDDA